MSKRVVSLDFGRRLGVTVFSDDCISVHEYELDRDLLKRYMQFWTILHVTKPDVIAYEKVNRHLGTDAAHQYGAYEGMVYLYAMLHGCAIHPVYVMTAKAFVGCARKPKEEMKRVVKDMYAEFLAGDMTDNMTDSFIIGLVSLREHNPELFEKIEGKKNESN